MTAPDGTAAESLTTATHALPNCTTCGHPAEPHRYRHQLTLPFGVQRQTIYTNADGPELIDIIAMASAEHLWSNDDLAAELVTGYDREKARQIINAIENHGYRIIK